MKHDLIIDDLILKKAMQLSGSTDMKSTIEAALKLFIRLKEQEKIREFRGKLKWDGDL